MLELIIIALLIAALAKLQTIHAAQKKTHAQDARIEIDIFKVNQNLATILLNLQNVVMFLPHEFTSIRRVMQFQTHKLDTSAAFERLKDNTNDEALRAVAMAAAMFAKCPPKEVKKPKFNPRKPLLKTKAK